MRREYLTACRLPMNEMNETKMIYFLYGKTDPPIHTYAAVHYSVSPPGRTTSLITDVSYRAIHRVCRPRWTGALSRLFHLLKIPFARCDKRFGISPFSARGISGSFDGAPAKNKASIRSNVEQYRIFPNISKYFKRIQ